MTLMEEFPVEHLPYLVYSIVEEKMETEEVLMTRRLSVM
jgi:hypothetical protein